MTRNEALRALEALNIREVTVTHNALAFDATTVNDGFDRRCVAKIDPDTETVLYWQRVETVDERGISVYPKDPPKFDTLDAMLASELRP